ncbi:hypothetical protein F7725_024319 [Dissostichus mawsoni]|uniref:Uncharacterized protein n=1 Tax=Dissostichus mawsoni TaxID=36200 RepID=A0A7J5Y1Z2_DISMA|nr:hypothetical protein F7725_024319 [Dissostichus mawsoni]
MKGSPDLIPAADLDPSRVCKGKGVVTLRATLVHIDEEGCISREPNVITAPSDWTGHINGDSSKAGLAEGGRNITADLPPVNNTQCKANSPESIKENQALWSTDIQNCVSSPSGSVYPCTSTVNPTIVLLQHNRDPTPERDKSPDPGRDSVSPDDMDLKRLRLSLHSPDFSPVNKPIVPVRAIEENPYRPTYIFPENCDIQMKSKDDCPTPFGYLEDVRAVPRSKSDAEMDSRGRSMPVPTRSSSLKPSAKRNEWEPPDKKVDTRKYRAEPKSIFEYEPGKSSVLKLERRSAPSFSPLETASNLQHYSSSKSGHSEVEKDGGSSSSEPGAPECERHVYKSVLEGGDIPLQGLRALNKRQASSSSSKACIPQILPSKFKPKLLPPSGDSQESRTKAVRHPKAHSCEELYTGPCDTDLSGAEERESGHYADSSSECGDRFRNVSPAIRRGASEFSSLYKSMHHIQRPSSAGCSPNGSVRNLASLFEKSKAEGGERSEADDGGDIPREAVSSRVSEFEMIIQRSSSAPRSSSMPTLNSGHSPDHSTATSSWPLQCQRSPFW